MIPSLIEKIPSSVWILLWGILLFIPFGGAIPLFDWDEINFAECAREMIVTGNYLIPQIDYEPFYEKPPLFFWLQAISFKIFGIAEGSARLPGAIAGILTLLLIFKTGLQVKDRALGWWWVLCYTASFLPHFYFRTGIIDPVLNLFIYAALLYTYQFFISGYRKYFLMAVIALGLALLTKGPVALIMVWGVMGIYLVWERRTLLQKGFQLAVLGIIAGILPAIWLWLLYIEGYQDFAREFVQYQIRLFTTADAGHAGFPGFHFVVVLLGCFPASILGLRTIFYANQLTGQRHFLRLQLILFWFVLILFSIVQSKIVHYSSMAYLPITFAAAMTISNFKASSALNPFLRSLLLGFGLIIGLALTIFPQLFYGDLLKGWAANDKFVQSILNLPSPWRFLDSLPGVLVMIAAILIYVALKRLSPGLLKAALITSAIAVNATIYVFPKRIAYYTQKDLIVTLQEQAPLVKIAIPVNHKSYAHLFYTRKIPPHLISMQKAYAISGTRDSILYFSRVDRPMDTTGYEGISEIKRKGGFIYYKGPALK